MSRDTPEGKVKLVVDRILKRHGIWYFKPVSNGMGQHGIGDFVCCVPPIGQFLMIECKGVDGKEPTDLQRMQLAGVALAGGLTFIATPGTVAALDVMLTLMKSNEDTNRTDV